VLPIRKGPAGISTISGIEIAGRGVCGGAPVCVSVVGASALVVALMSGVATTTMPVSAAGRKSATGGAAGSTGCCGNACKISAWVITGSSPERKRYSSLSSSLPNASTLSDAARASSSSAVA